MPFDLAHGSIRNRDPGLGLVDMRGTGGPQFPPLAFLWPALAAETASEFASAMAREFINLAVGPGTETGAPEPQFATRSKVVLELATVRLRGFSTASDGPATLVCAPFALHGAAITDLAPRHSLVAALQRAGIERVFVTDWRSASTDMRLLSIDNYVANLNVLVDELGGAVDLVGLCQGGWMALAYAARFPTKVRKLVLAGAPIDIAAGNSKLSDLARNTPMAIFKELVDLGGGRILGHRVRQLWALSPLDREAVHHLLQSPDAIDRPPFGGWKPAFTSGTHGPSICRAPTTCRSSSSCSRKTVWLAVASRSWAAQSISPACDVRCFCSRPAMTTWWRLNRSSRPRISSIPGTARSREPPRRAGISACSWAGRS